MAELFTFLDTPDRFSWWMVEGLGGMGKSRLAMEFCTLAKAQGYYAGFYKLDNSVLPDNDKLLSGKLPILMVIDYAMSNMAKTIEVLSFIQDKVNTAATYGASAPKIRVLLLDRKFSKEWFSSVSYIKAYVYQPENHPTLQLSKDSEDIRWRIIEQVLNKEDESEEQLLLAKFSARKSEIMNALDNLDVEKRPLYAFFATEALIYDPKRDIKNWNVHSLLDFHLHRLKNRIWAKKQGYLDHEFWVVKLLALNTLARSLTKEEISDFLRANSDLSTSEQKVVKETYYSIAEYQLEDGAYTFYGLQPDILGRIFYFDSV